MYRALSMSLLCASLWFYLCIRHASDKMVYSFVISPFALLLKLNTQFTEHIDREKKREKIGTIQKELKTSNVELDLAFAIQSRHSRARMYVRVMSLTGHKNLHFTRNMLKMSASNCGEWMEWMPLLCTSMRRFITYSVLFICVCHNVAVVVDASKLNSGRTLFLMSLLNSISWSSCSLFFPCSFRCCCCFLTAYIFTFVALPKDTKNT